MNLIRSTRLAATLGPHANQQEPPRFDMQIDWRGKLSLRAGQPAGLLRGVRFIVMLCISLGLSGIAGAQKDAASIVGIVEDPSGAVVPGAQITITDVDRGTSFVTSTDRAGNYVASPLKIGRYNVKVGKKDFRTVVIGPFELQLGQRREVTVKLQIGEALQNVEVNAVPCAKDTDVRSGPGHR